MRNIEVVTSHLSRKIKILGGDPRRETLTLVPAIDGNSYLRTGEGNIGEDIILLVMRAHLRLLKTWTRYTKRQKHLGNFKIY